MLLVRWLRDPHRGLVILVGVPAARMVGLQSGEVMQPTSLAEQLLTLGSRAKLVVGIVLAVGGCVACGILWQRGWVVGWACLAVLLGVSLTAVGWSDWRREQAIERELTRARREWQELARLLRAATAAGQGVVPFLRARGYRAVAVSMLRRGAASP